MYNMYKIKAWRAFSQEKVKTLHLLGENEKKIHKIEFAILSGDN